jgi:hypothetical protein
MITVCQISRGIAPVECMIEASDMAELFGAEYLPIWGKPLVEAKNKAVEYAMQSQADLLLVEDDILADVWIWEAALSCEDNGDILIATTRNRDGTPNTKKSPKGKFLYTGNIFTLIPHDVLCKLDIPIFRAWNFSQSDDGEILIMKDENKHGQHSDVYFWYKVMQLDPPPVIRTIGEVSHVKTPYNTGHISHNEPFVIETY